MAVKWNSRCLVACTFLLCACTVSSIRQQDDCHQSWVTKLVVHKSTCVAARREPNETQTEGSLALASTASLAPVQAHKANGESSSKSVVEQFASVIVQVALAFQHHVQEIYDVLQILMMYSWAAILMADKGILDVYASQAVSIGLASATGKVRQIVQTTLIDLPDDFEQGSTAIVPTDQIEKRKGKQYGPAEIDPLDEVEQGVIRFLMETILGGIDSETIWGTAGIDSFGLFKRGFVQEALDASQEISRLPVAALKLAALYIICFSPGPSGEHWDLFRLLLSAAFDALPAYEDVNWNSEKVCAGFARKALFRFAVVAAWDQNAVHGLIARSAPFVAEIIQRQLKPWTVVNNARNELVGRYPGVFEYFRRADTEISTLRSRGNLDQLDQSMLALQNVSSEVQSSERR